MIGENDLVFERFSYGVGDFNEMVGPVRVGMADVEAVALARGLLLIDLGELAGEASQAEKLEAELAEYRAQVNRESLLQSDLEHERERAKELEQREASLLDDIEQLTLETTQLRLERDTWKETARTRGDTVIKLAEKLCACEVELETATVRGRELVEEAQVQVLELESRLEEAERVRVELSMDIQFGRVPAEYRELLAGHVKWLGESTLDEKG